MYDTKYRLLYFLISRPACSQIRLRPYALSIRSGVTLCSFVKQKGTARRLFIALPYKVVSIH